MGKEFKTIDELVSLLEARGVRTDKDTKRIIERESYYAIVNGYKAPFLDREAMSRSNNDVFRQGVEFKWMYDLFLFDRDLRSITLVYLTRSEAVVRTSVVYAFCHNHPEREAYLERPNYCDSKGYLVPRAFKGDKANLHSKNLSDLMSRLNDKLVVRSHSRDFIKHYMKAHGYVPLWVLSNDLTFGNIIHLYQLMQQNDRREACTIIARVSKRDSAQGYLTERKLLRTINILNDFRNLCAHDERLYCARPGNVGYSDMVVHLFNVLPREEVAQFARDITALLASYEGRLHNVDARSLLKDMGFEIGEA